MADADGAGARGARHRDLNQEQRLARASDQHLKKTHRVGVRRDGRRQHPQHLCGKEGHLPASALRRHQSINAFSYSTKLV